MTDRYKGKLFSLLGDSISTFENFNPRFHPVYYKHEKRVENGVLKVEDTWWHTVIEHFGGKLLVNSSWSGGTVVKLPDRDELYPSGCSEKRICELCKGDIAPDIIIVYLGTNDWAYGTYHGRKEPLESFGNAYDEMIKRICSKYSRSEIWCVSINEAMVSKYPSARFKHVAGDVHIEKYNEIIKNVSKKYRCQFVDIYGRHIPYDTLDGAHPNKKGMSTLAKLFIEEIEKQIAK